MSGPKRFIVPGIVLGFLLIIFLWVMHHGFIEINVQGVSPDSEVTFRLYDQAGNKKFNESNSSSTLKKFVNNGAYTSLVTQGEKSDFRPADVLGFFKTTDVEAVLKPEKNREFIGDNPSFCMYYEVDILYSFNCGLGGLTAHLPATATLPTTTQSEDENSAVPSKGMVAVGGSNKVLVTEGEDNSVQLYDIDSQLKLTNPVTLTGIKAEDTSGVVPYQQGFVINNSDLSVFKYFSSPTSQPETLTITSPAEATNPVELSVHGKEVGVLFNTSGDGSDPEDDTATSPAPIEGGSSEFVLASGTSYAFNKIYTSGGLCGSNRLCLISGGVLDIYDTSSGEAEYVFSIRGAQKAFSKDGKIVIATNSAVLALDEVSLDGAIQISYGSSGYCGIAPAKTGFVLCLINKKDKKAALYVDMKQANADSIDKKISALLNSPDVDNVSIYKNFIYISPNLGQAVRDKNTGYYGYPASLKQSVGRKIKLLVKDLNIDTTKYSVVNPYD